jgi:hypothetical protein
VLIALRRQVRGGVGRRRFEADLRRELATESVPGEKSSTSSTIVNSERGEGVTH